MRNTLPVALAVILSLGGTVATLNGAETPKGMVDWNGGFIRGVGTGTAQPTENRVKDRMMAVRAAEVLAQRALAETIYGIRVDGATTMRDAIQDYIVNSQVQGVIRGAQKVREEVAWDGNVPMATVELRICLVADAPQCRSASSLVGTLPLENRKEPAYVPSVYYEDVPDAENPETRSKARPRIETASYDTNRPVTGLILKTEGLRFERELFPVVVTRERGQLQTVFSAKSVKPEVVRTYGVARYADSADQALKDPRLGNNPAIVPVLEVTRENMLVIRVDAARAIRETTRYGNDYLGDAKVVVAGR